MVNRGDSADSHTSEHYRRMQLQSTEHQDLPCTLGMFDGALFRSESMDLKNDPRFFQANVLNKRLAAFGKLGVVSSLMVSTCSHVIEMKKELNFQSVEGWLRAVGFCLMSIVLLLNIIATYVGIAQTYHTYRLETAGPTGFEIATSYYLNKNIAAWRHIAVKCLLNGLTIFLISTGIRVSVSFEANMEDEPKITERSAHIMGALSLTFFVVGGLIVHYIHIKHTAVFRTNYDLAKASEKPYMDHVDSSVRSRGFFGSYFSPEV